MTATGYRPASHPVIQRARRAGLRDDGSGWLEPPLRGTQPHASDSIAIEDIARLVARLGPPLSVSQRRELRAIADAVYRLAEGGRL